MGTVVLPVGVVVGAVVLAGLLLVLLLWVWRELRRSRAAFQEERHRHDTTRDELRRLEGLELVLRRLSSAGSETAVAELAADAATTLLGGHGTVLVLRAAEDLLVTRTAATATDAGDDRAAHELARHALDRRATVSAPVRDGPDGAPAEHVLLATPLRDGEQLLGALVTRTPRRAARSGRSDVALVERLAAHVARAVVRVTGGVVVSTDVDERNGTDPGTSTASRRAAALQVNDLAAPVRANAERVRAQAATQGHPRRVAVLAPPRAATPLPEEAVEALVARAFDLVLDHTEAGSNLAVEVLAMEGGWELVVTHAGAAIDETVLAASPLPSMVAALGGTIESGEGAGVARVRVRLPHGGVEPEVLEATVMTSTL